MCSNLSIFDAPAFAYRGLVLDVSHRYFPLATISSVLDGMMLSRLNALSLHFAADQYDVVQSTAFPGLNRGPTYTAAEIQKLITWGKSRGIVVTPQVCGVV